MARHLEGLTMAGVEPPLFLNQWHKQGRKCVNCKHWSQWMTSVGDCVWWHHQWFNSLTGDRDLPQPPRAIQVPDYHLCDKWEERDASTRTNPTGN